MELTKVGDTKKRVIFKPGDDGEEEEVVLGRGPLLEITDVRLSRSVAKMRRRPDGEVVLTRGGNKPVFVQKGDGEEMEEVGRGQEVVLSDGSKIALAAGDTQHVYLVSMPKQGRGGNKVEIPDQKGEKEKGAQPSKKRDLPAWMMEVAEGEEEEEEEEENPAPKPRRKDTKLPVKKSPKAKKEEAPTSPKRSPKKAESASLNPSPRPSPAGRAHHQLSDEDDEEEGAKPLSKSPRKRTPTSSPRKKAALSPSPRGHHISESEEEDEKEEETEGRRRSPKKKGKSFPKLVTKDDFKDSKRMSGGTKWSPKCT